MSGTWKICCFTLNFTIPQRWVTILMCFLGLFHAYAMRTCLSIAITEMVAPSNNTMEFADDTCPGNVSLLQKKNQQNFSDKLFDWSEYTQGVILSSFYWGYIFTNLVGGIITVKLGGRHTLGFSILSTAILTLITPYTVHLGGSTSLIFLRILMGLGEGTMYPAISVLMAQWIPEDERGKAGAFSYSGASLGTIVGMMATGLILHYSTWPTVFYFFGILGLIQFFLNIAFCFSNPNEHPFIAKAEAKYLKEKLRHIHDELPPVPWRYILQSKPVYALLFASIGNAWGFLTIATDMPKYMSSVLKFSIEDNGYFSSVPYCSMWICSCISSSIADSMIAKGQISIHRTRKIGVAISSLGPGIFILAASYAGCNGFLVVILLTICMTLMGCATFSSLINPLDLGPNYAGALTGLVNGASTLGGIISPYVVGVITPNQTISEWRIVFWIVFIFFFGANCIFLMYGSGELQEWNDPEFLKNQRKNRCSGNDVKEAAIQLMSINRT